MGIDEASDDETDLVRDMVAQGGWELAKNPEENPDNDDRILQNDSAPVNIFSEYIPDLIIPDEKPDPWSMVVSDADWVVQLPQQQPKKTIPVDALDAAIPTTTSSPIPIPTNTTNDNNSNSANAVANPGTTPTTATATPAGSPASAPGQGSAISSGWSSFKKWVGGAVKNPLPLGRGV
jgi:hypothetical protein